MEPNKLITVRNRCGGTVVYTISERNTRKQFQPNEVKKIPFEELEALSYQQGGKALLYHYLMIDDADALRELINGTEEPEYWLTEAQIPNWLNTCSMAQFEDAINFAPEGVKELIRQYSVSVPLRDTEKRKLVNQKLDFDVDAAVKNAEADKEQPGQELNNSTPNITVPTPGATQRKTTPTYKVVRTETK